MPDNPHEYSLRKHWTSEASFEQVVEFIRAHGHQTLYEARSYTYLDVDDHAYWTMGGPVHQTMLINRKYVESSPLASTVARAGALVPLARGAELILSGGAARKVAT